MPTYEFRCPQGHDFEKFYRSMSTAAFQVTCPVCGAVAERQMSAGAGLVFKGSGFYITDYGKDGKKDQREAQAKANDAKTSDAKGSDATGSDSKGSDSKAGDSTASDSKAGDAKASDTKATESKPVDTKSSSSTSAPSASPPASKAGE